MPLCPNKNSPDKDMVMTPKYLAEDIIRYFNPTGVIMDPCKGEGAFYDLMPEGSLWCELSKNVDFFDFKGRVDWLITNPPWSEIAEFIAHGMKISDNIVYLAVINHFVTRKRLRDIYLGGFGIKEIRLHSTPPLPWTQSGFQVCSCHLKRGHRGPWVVSSSDDLGWEA